MPDMSKKFYTEVNKQIQEELYSAYLYYAMAAWFDAKNLPGFAHWLRVQTMEEVTHGHRFYHHIIERRAEIELLDIKKPPKEWASPLAAFQDAFKHEQHITKCIHDLVAIAREDGDYTAEVGVLNWFVAEQIEEETSTDAVVQKLRMAGDDQNALYLLDKEMAMRTFVPAPDFTW